MSTSQPTADRIRGCLLGGAVGDALGASVEFLTIDEIRQQYGAAGITEYDVAFGRRGAITDDTQMTLFTAEGLLRAVARYRAKGVSHPPSALHHAYVRWLQTQGYRGKASLSDEDRSGWLLGVAGLHNRRAPGRTCLSALCGDRMGTLSDRLNDSKGCGGVMRAAPVGLITANDETAFRLGCESAAVTHGHPSGFYSAGCLAAIICALHEGLTLPVAIARALYLLTRAGNADHDECAAAIRRALNLSFDTDANPSPEVVTRLGGGWVGEEALAIALYCALRADGDFARGVRLAVNHSGDSDSTGAITGNILGVMLGAGAIPSAWVRELELRDEIETMARDLLTQFDDSAEWRTRYPA